MIHILPNDGQKKALTTPFERAIARSLETCMERVMSITSPHFCPLGCRQATAPWLDCLHAYFIEFGSKVSNDAQGRFLRPDHVSTCVGFFSQRHGDTHTSSVSTSTIIEVFAPWSWDAFLDSVGGVVVFVIATSKARHLDIANLYTRCGQLVINGWRIYRLYCTADCQPWALCIVPWKRVTQQSSCVSIYLYICFSIYLSTA